LPIAVEQRFSITTRLPLAFENQRTGRTECVALGESAHHRAIGWIARILLVNLRRHSHERSINLASRNDAVPLPVSDMLRRYAQGCAILHQTDIVNIRYLRTADPLLDPADNIAEDS